MCLCRKTCALGGSRQVPHAHALHSQWQGHPASFSGSAWVHRLATRRLLSRHIFFPCPFSPYKFFLHPAVTTLQQHMHVAQSPTTTHNTLALLAYHVSNLQLNFQQVHTSRLLYQKMLAPQDKQRRAKTKRRTCRPSASIRPLENRSLPLHQPCSSEHINSLAVLGMGMEPQRTSVLLQISASSGYLNLHVSEGVFWQAMGSTRKTPTITSLSFLVGHQRNCRLILLNILGGHQICHRHSFPKILGCLARLLLSQPHIHFHCLTLPPALP